MSRRCPSCGTENAADARFCSACGSAVPTPCPACSVPVPAGARFCPACGRALGEEAAPDERKIATILFVDLVGSTPLAEELEPERLRSVLGTYFAALSTTIAAWGGTVEKYIGDAVVAVFGVPRVREDDATRAISAGLEILTRLAGLDADLASRGVPPLAVRMGVNTGDVIVPQETRADRTLVLGDAVNVAARLEQAAGPGEIIVGERTAQLAVRSFRFSDPILLELKGKAAPVRARRVLGRREDADGDGAAQGRVFRSRMVGRDPELAALGDLLAEVRDRAAPRLAIVLGPAGIGKSRLIREFLAAAGAEIPDLLVLRGRCPAAGQGASLWAFAEIVRAVCGLSLDTPAQESARRLEARIDEICLPAGLTAGEAQMALFAMAITAGISIEGNTLERIRAGEIAAEVVRQWPRLLSILAADRPVVVLIEDLHWASDISLDLLQALVVRSRGHLLLLATARPEFLESHPALAALEETTVVSLRPLSPTAGEAMIDELVSGDSLPDELLTTLVLTAEGNPLFLEELLAGLIDAGHLAQVNGRWRLQGRLADLALPDTIQGVIAARIDALEPDEKRVLQEAAVVGRAFWEPPVAMAVGVPTIAEPVGRLERRGMVFLRSTSSLAGQDEYFIKHALVRDVAYGGLPRTRRSRAHAAVARWLAAISADRPEELAELVAWHWAAATEEGSEVAWDGDPRALAAIRREAVPALLAGGAAARKRYAPEEALAFHEAALRLAGTDEERARAHEEIGDDHDIAYHGDLAVPAWNAALALLGDRPDSDAEAGAARARLAYKAAYMAAFRWGGFKTPIDPAEIDRFLDIGLAAIPSEDRLGRAPLLAVRAQVASRWASFGRPDPVPIEDRARDGEMAWTIANATGDARLEVNALRGLTGAYCQAGDPARSVDAARRSMKAAQRVETTYVRHLFTMVGANTVAWLAGDFEGMLPVFRSLLETSQELEPHDVLHSTFGTMACLYYLGRWDELDETLAEHERMFAREEDMACPFVRGGMMIGGLALARRGQADRARAVIAKVPATEAPIGMVEGLQSLALVALGDLDAGIELALRTLGGGSATAAASGTLPRRSSAEEPPIELLALLEGLTKRDGPGDRASVEAMIATARERAGELALLVPQADLGEGRLTDSVDAIRRAIVGFDRLSRYEAARARDALAELVPEEAAALRSAAAGMLAELGVPPEASAPAGPPRGALA